MSQRRKIATAVNRIAAAKHDGVVEGAGLVDVRGVPGARHDDFLRVADRGSHVVGRGEEVRVIGSDKDERGDRDIPQ